MKQVTKEQFFAVVGELNVHPHPRDPDKTTWELPSKAVVGISHPGYKNPHDPTAYFLNDQYIKEQA